MSAKPARILATGTALPPIRLDQDAVRERTRLVLGPAMPGFERFAAAFENAGIDTRWSCVPLDWYGQPHGWVERSALFEAHAVALIVRAVQAALAQAGRRTDEVDTIAVACTTGIATPNLDALALAPLGLRPGTRRLPMFGFGCCGGVLGLVRAAEIATARPGSLVLFVAVELCALTFRAGDASKANIIAAALFGDGAAAVLLSTEGGGPALVASAEHTWPDSRAVMGWNIAEDGLSVVFSRDIPTLVGRDLRPVADRFLAQQGLAIGDLDRLVCHPGGTKVLVALETAFAQPAGTLAAEREVLRHHGNMSSPTVLFVLDQHLRAGMGGRSLMLALGPGFTAGLALLEQP